MNDIPNDIEEDNDPWLCRKQAYRRTGIAPSTFATWDCRKTYDLKPKMRRGRIHYRQSILDAVMTSRLVRQGRTLNA